MDGLFEVLEGCGIAVDEDAVAGVSLEDVLKEVVALCVSGEVEVLDGTVDGERLFFFIEGD